MSIATFERTKAPRAMTAPQPLPAREPLTATQPLTVASWPQAILHVDADAFFASCEQVIHPALAGRPVVTGRERGIVAAASYEAKAAGVKRGMRLFEVERVCPKAVILPSDYETYSLFSLRMFEILRRFTPVVEEYSIDEAFADITGLRRKYHGSYKDIAYNVQQTILQELKLHVTVGVSLSKVLAKVASKYAKPRGITGIPGREIHEFIERLPVGEIWGIGPNTTNFLNKHGIYTALQFARLNEKWVRDNLTKPHVEVWHELNGRSIYSVSEEPREAYKSISKAKTFTPASSDRDFVFAQMARNLENACAKARRHELAARRVVIYMRTQDFRDRGMELHLSRASACPVDMIGLLRKGFNEIFDTRSGYRSTAVILSHLMPAGNVQPNLFEEPLRIERVTRIYTALDHLTRRYGKHTVSLSVCLPAKLQAQHEGARGDVPWRKTALLKGENFRQRLGLPLLDIKV
ncbi:MAG TPA: DNA polymerase IV [Abditibacteriaceae bacterium]|jgi:DNA polymerase-4/DNA polymerase V